MGFGIARAGHDKDTLPLNTVEILRPWTLQGYHGVGHCRSTCALHGYSAVGHCRDTLLLSTALRLGAEGGDNKDF